jgi:photosystem II stability/assembly factor-like uncharacterized protein
MKKILFILFLILSAITSAQNFFPTKAGDIYQLEEVFMDWINAQVHESYRHSLATEITFNSRTYVWAWDNYYHMDTTSNKLYILLNNEEKLAFDFNKADGDTDTLYFDGTAQLYTYSSSQNSLILGDYRMVRIITNNYIDGPIKYHLAEDIGIYKYELVDIVGNYNVWEHVLSAIIDDSVYNPINLGLTANLPNRIARAQTSFSFLVNINTEYIELVDSLKAYVVVYKSDSLIYQNNFIGSVELQKIVISIPSQILSQADSIGIRVHCTDRSIFNNEAFYPQSGYKFIPVDDEVEWTLFTPALSGMNYMGMKFFSENKGYIYKTNGDVFNLIFYDHRTTDGGQSFNTSFGNWNYWLINDIISFDENTGYMIIDQLKKTTNQGTTWETILNAGDWAAMSFLDKDTGWVSDGYQTKIYRTYNGGVNWETFNTGLQEPFRLVAFVQLNEGYAVTAYGKVYRSTDGGETWQFTNSTVAYHQKKLKMFQNGKGWLVGNGIWRTEDAGISWSQQYEGNFVDAYFFSKDKGWVIGKVNETNILLSTIDGGNNWSPVEVPHTQGSFVDIDFVDELHGWIYAHSIYSNELLRTTNGGVTFVEDERSSDVQPADFQLSQNYPNPFNPSTTISWQSPVASWQTIKLYNALGQEVDTIVDEYLPAGFHSKLYIVNSTLPSGVYFYQLKTANHVETKKMIFIK